MKRTYLLLITAAALFTGCNKREIIVNNESVVENQVDRQMLTLAAAMPEEKPQTRAALSRSEDGNSIFVKWKAGDKVQFFFKKQDGAVVKGSEEFVAIVLGTNDKKATFNVTLPEGVSAPYTVYLVHGATATTDGGKIEVDVSPVGFKKLEDLVTPLAGKAEVVAGSSTGNIALEHLGALHCLSLVNYHISPSQFNAGNTLEETVSLDYTGDSWFYGAGSKYDLVSESITAVGSGATPWQQVTVAAWQSEQLVQWVMPNGNIPQEIRLKSGALVSVNSKPIRRASLQKGHAYHLHASVNHHQTMLKFAEPLVWAGSNIYWSELNQKLTFDETVVDVSRNTDLKQGVFFPWGSLLAVSKSGYDSNPADQSYCYSPIYRPSAPETSIWRKLNGLMHANPFYNTDIPSGGQTNAFLNEAAQNTDAMYNNDKGDICKYLSKIGAVSGNWRMPTAAELNASYETGYFRAVYWTNTSLPWNKFGISWADIYNYNASGTTIIDRGGEYTVGGVTVRFPASGYRDNEGYSVRSVGARGFYWSCSGDVGLTSAYAQEFRSNQLTPAYVYARGYGYAVRCVRDN